MILKMMSGENLPDNDTRKQCVIIGGVKSVEMVRPSPGGVEDKNQLWIVIDGQPESESHWMHGNAYMMNDSGKTIQTFSPNPISPEEARVP